MSLYGVWPPTANIGAPTPYLLFYTRSIEKIRKFVKKSIFLTVLEFLTILRPMSQPGRYPSLYFHFPFCETKCHYCDFYSLGREKTKLDDPTLFELAMIEEIRLRGQAGDLAAPVETIFLGGGTPSMTEPASMERIFAEFFKYATLTKDIEWTMEANPSSIELEQFKRYRALGLNRVSMGVQSLKNEHLANLGRVHDEGQAIKALNTVFEAGFDNVSTDLLCGVPGQTLNDLESHMEKLTSFPISHLSIYLLTLTKTHKMYKDLPNEDVQLSHLLFIDEYMRAKGFEHYEISNFAKPGKRARHNLAYWTEKSYLGFGPSAHSFEAETSSRFKNISSLHRYAEELSQKSKLPVEWTEHLSAEERDLEKWMLAIRLAEGFPIAWLLSDRQKSKAARMLKEGFLEVHPEFADRYRATARGFSMSDAVVKELA
jgi:oxygen-independent coproporphyrinogen-3 oxidase